MIKTITPAYISNFIETQFPNFYKEEGTTFIQFVKNYFEWLEQSGNPLYYSRQYYDIKDIDQTLDEFVVHFKNKYFSDIQLDTSVDIRRIVKHALDIYRSKGTERQLKLLFKMVYNDDINIYLPSKDLFKTSDGEWYKNTYLELSLNDLNSTLIKKKIIGSVSKATAYVDSVVRKLIKNTLTDVCYISSLNGNFITKELIYPEDYSIDLPHCPYIIGSLNNIDISVSGTGKDYSVGSIVNLYSNSGIGAKGLVTSLTNQFGIINFTLEDGGYGFTNNATIHISENILSVNNITIKNNESFQYFYPYDLVTQKLGYINYVEASGYFFSNSQIKTYYSNGSVMGEGTIIQVTQTNATAGIIYCSVNSGNLENAIFTTGNLVSANLSIANGFFEEDTTAQCIAMGPVSLYVNNVSGTFETGERIQHNTSFATVISFIDNVLLVNKLYGTFDKNHVIIGKNSKATATIYNIKMDIGVINVNNAFTSVNNNYFESDTFSGSVVKIDTGINADFILNKFTYTENITYANTLLKDFLDVEINATEWGFPGDPSANLLSNPPIIDLLSYDNTTIGVISGILTTNPGENYTNKPLYLIDEPVSKYSFRYDYKITLDADAGFLSVNDYVTQNSTNARGIIKSISGADLYIKNLNYYPDNDFIETSNTTTILLDNTTGITANIIAVSIDYYAFPGIGNNAIISGDLAIGRDAIASISIIDSGFGYRDGELITIDDVGEGIASIEKQGVSQGYYRVKGGVLSENKKLFDGYYWQNYSYEILSSVMLNKYKKMLEQIGHVAGTKMFGKIQYKSMSDTPNSITKTKINVS